MSTTPLTSSEPGTTFQIAGIYTAYDVVFKENYIFTGERHPFWEIVYVKSGSVQVVEDENTYTLYDGDMICHAPNEFHRIRSSGGTTPHMHILSFSSSGELPQEIKSGVFSLSVSMSEEYERLFTQLYVYNRWSKGLPPKGAYTGVEPGISLDGTGREGILRLSAFLLSLSRALRKKDGLYDSPRAKEYRNIVKGMEEHLDDNLSLDELSRLFHLSKSYITKLFKSYCGEGPMKYYAKLRILRVQELLLEGKTLQYISDEMNYSSLSYLSYSFKRAVGSSVNTWLARQK